MTYVPALQLRRTTLPNHDKDGHGEEPDLTVQRPEYSWSVKKTYNRPDFIGGGRVTPRGAIPGQILRHVVEWEGVSREGPLKKTRLHGEGRVCGYVCHCLGLFLPNQMSVK